MVCNRLLVNTEKQKYCTPDFSTYSFYGEAGFALSEQEGLPGEDPTINDYGDF